MSNKNEAPKKEKTHQTIMKAKLKIHRNTPKAAREILERELKRIVNAFNKKFKGSGASLTLTKKNNEY